VVQAAIALVLVVSAGASASAAQIVFTRVNIVSMADDRVSAPQDVLIEAGRIVRIAPSGERGWAPDATVIEGQGRYLMPGIAEMHAHVPGPDQKPYAHDVLRLLVAHGVTTIRGMLGHPWHLELREQLAAGEVLGPRLFTAGPSLNGRSVPDVATAQRMVREQKTAGYDFLKLHPGLGLEVFDAIAASAREYEIPFEGHVSDDVGLRHALSSGQRAIDHLDGYVQALSDPACMQPREGGFFGIGFTECIDEAAIPALIDRTRRAGAAIVPTEILLERWARPPQAAELRKWSSVRYVAPATLDRWLTARKEFLDAPWSGASDRFVAVRRRLIHDLDAAGVLVLLGSDAPQIMNVPGDSALSELDLYVQAGLSPYRALRTATTGPAHYFDAGDQFGRVAEGLEADLLLLAANPLENVSALRRLDGVMLRGRWLSRAELDGLLDAVAARARD
jgi:cytosine/adenosine deaminase-related metal-dependent hydrolase